MRESIIKTEDQSLSRAWFPVCAALLVTLGIFLILPLLEWFNRDTGRQYVLREVDVAKIPEVKPPVSMQPPDSPVNSMDPPTAPPLRLPEKAAAKWTLNAAVPMLKQSEALPALLPQPGIEMDFAALGTGYWELSEVDQPPMPLSQMKPMYPLRARNADIEGYVVLEMIVDAQGLISQVDIAEAEPPGYFEKAALRSAAAWRFSAAKKDGSPVPVRVVQKLTFRLDDEAK